MCDSGGDGDQLLMGRLTASSSVKYHKNISQQEASSEVLGHFKRSCPVL